MRKKARRFAHDTRQPQRDRNTLLASHPAQHGQLR
jgi:hypothetical protein